ncbi:MAG: hypothetical protein JO331_02210 [Verrucomicrobia bacterium]|nr:hypothetical protein [Verrucomicrobiota bacterium]
MNQKKTIDPQKPEPGSIQNIRIGVTDMDITGKSEPFSGSEGDYVRVRNRILDPGLDKRLFPDEKELVSYFDLGTGSTAVIDQLLTEGFLEKLGSRIELCRFEPATWIRCVRLRINLDSLSSRLALPRLRESELDRIQLAGCEFFKGPRLLDCREQILAIMSVLHQAARRPLFSIVTQDLHRQINPYTYFDHDRTLFDNLKPLLLNFSNYLRTGTVEKLCREISRIYQENCRILTGRLTEFKRHHKDAAAQTRVLEKLLSL